MSCEHDWTLRGGRQCPRNPDARCSQPVYVCAECGLEDYGDPGGPGHKECMVDGPCHRTCTQSKRARKLLRKELAAAERQKRKRELFIAFYAMNGDPVWYCADGRRMKFSEMETSHVRNTLAAIERGHDRNGRVVRVKTLTVQRLKLELGFREAHK